MKKVVTIPRRCLDCGVLVSQKAERCRNCFHISTRGRKAWNSGTRKPRLYTCVDCGAKNEYGGGKPKRCRECFRKHLSKIVKASGHVPPVQWGNKNRLGKRHTEETKNKISMTKVVNNGGVWNGRVNSFACSVRNSLEYRKWRKMIFEKDDYACVVCGKRGGRIEADHYPVRFSTLLNEAICLYGQDINKIRKYLPLWIAKGRTVCKEHHDNRFGNKVINKKDYV